MFIKNVIFVVVMFQLSCKVCSQDTNFEFYEYFGTEYFWSTSINEGIANSYGEADCICRGMNGNLAFITTRVSDIFIEQIHLTNIGE